MSQTVQIATNSSSPVSLYTRAPVAMSYRGNTDLWLQVSKYPCPL